MGTPKSPTATAGVPKLARSKSNSEKMKIKQNNFYSSLLICAILHNTNDPTLNKPVLEFIKFTLPGGLLFP